MRRHKALAWAGVVIMKMASKAWIVFFMAGMVSLAFQAFAGEAPKAGPESRTLIGTSAPAFTAETTQGALHFPRETRALWTLLVTYPTDFSPVAATELLTLAAMVPEFRALNCDILAMSQDTLSCHIAWLRSIQEKLVYKNMKGVNVNFPLIADAGGEIARAFGLPAGLESRRSSAVVLVDPKNKIRVFLEYPGTLGRSFMEIKRLLVALETSDAYGVETPSDWQPGEDVIVPAPDTVNGARLSGGNSGVYSPEWYLNLKKLGRDRVPPAPISKER